MDRNNQINFWRFSITLWIGACSIGHHINRYLDASNKINRLRHQEIQTKNDSDLKKMIGLGRKTLLLKLHCKQASELKINRKVGSLQAFYDVYPIRANIIEISNWQQLNQEFWVSKQFSQRLLFAKTQQENVFQIKHQHIPIERGFFSSVLFISASIVAFFADMMIRIFTFQLNSGKVLIGGPAYGMLETTFNLVTDHPLVVECDIENGMITPKVMGLTKEEIIEFYQSQKISHLFLVLAWAGCLFLLRKKIKRWSIDPLWKVIKNFLNIFTEKKREGMILLNADVQNELLCIICMHRCRNIIFENCKHFSICNQCRQEYGKQQIGKCPLCRKETNQEFIFVQSYEQGLH